MASFVTNKKIKATIATGSMQVKFAAGSGYIERIQALGPTNTSSSLQHLSTGDVGPTSVVSESLSPLLALDIPNGSVVEGPLNEIRVKHGSNTFLVYYKGDPTITQG